MKGASQARASAAFLGDVREYASGALSDTFGLIMSANRGEDGRRSSSAACLLLDPYKTCWRRVFCHSTAIQAAAEVWGTQFRRAGISAAATALLNRYPCPAVHQLALRYAHGPASSTPSAVVCKPNPFARPRMARTI